MKESRLIGYNLSDFNDPTKYNSRIAEANSAQQQATRDAALNSVTRDYYGNDVPTNVAPKTMDNVSNSFEPTPTGTSKNYQVSTPTQGTAGLMSEARTVYGAQPGQKTVYDNTTKTTVNIPDGEIAMSAYNRLVESGLTAQQAADKLNDPSYKQGIAQASNTYGTTKQQSRDAQIAAIPGKITVQTGTDKYGNGVFTQIDDPNYAKNVATTKSTFAQEDANTLDNANFKEGQKNKYTPKIDTKQFETTKKKIDELDSLLETLTPEVKAAAGYEIMTLRNQAANVDTQVKEITDTYQSDAEIEGEFVDDKARAETTEKRFLDLADKNLKTMKEVAEYNRDMLEIDKKIMEQKAAEDEAKQVKANIQNERKLRRQLNALGIETDTSGLDFLNDSIQEGQDALAGLRSANSLNSLKANLAIGEGYRLEVQKALDAHEGQYLNITNQTQEKLDAISNSIAQAKSERQKGKREALKWGAEQKNLLEKDLGAKITAANYKMMDQQNTLRDDERAQEELGWDRLENVIKTYGSFAPQSLLDSIAKQLPWVDVASLAKQMTLAEMKQFKVKNGGGSGGGGIGGGSYDPAAVTPEGQPFSDVTPQQLREAVDRVTLNFGGTGAERNRKRAEYLGRISSGESTASIMTSMQADYWASQKGASRTAHDGRTIAQGSAESLESYIEYYGIGENDDGPLGIVDSKVEGFASWFGLSSEQYNNLAAEVGTIRAKLVKENYGSAVSQQELALAKSYIPSMSDKGGQFISKVQNLKAYNAYLDAKVFASQAGLPAPKAPPPVTMTGTAVAGPGKYSPDDINSALQ